MSTMSEYNSFRRRYAEVRAADDARNALIVDLLQQVDDMQKTMERNAFVLVLIDGDNMNVRAISQHRSGSGIHFLHSSSLTDT